MKAMTKRQPKPESTGKLTSEQRKAAIVKAVRQTFAEKGFHGTTTRELAKVAGVSEALLFKHFPNKEALYAAMLVSCREQLRATTFERLGGLEPCASTLVILVHILISNFLAAKGLGDEDPSIQTRLMLQSILEDGEFARLRLQQLGEFWIPKIEACLQAAIAAGEAVEGPPPASVRGWLMHQLASGVRIHLLPPTQLVEFEVFAERLAEQVVWFALRGMGLTDEAIKRYYNPAALALFAG